VKKDILCRPFAPEQVKTRQGQNGKTLSYVETHAVIVRLNEGCDSWGFEIVEHHVMDDEVVVVGRLTADGVVKMAFGGSSITRDKATRSAVSIADDLKAAGSDALKKAASLLGVGLELYGGQQGREQKAGNGNGARSAPSDLNDRLTSRQLSAIHGVARREGITRDELTGLLMARTGKERAEILTRAEASTILDALASPRSNGAHA